MPIFSSTQPSLRARVIPRFPANVIAGAGMTITKNGSTYLFESAAVIGLPLASLENIQPNRLVGRDLLVGPPIQLTVAGGLQFTGTNGLQLAANQRLRTLTFTISGSPITTGIKGDLLVPYACTIQQVTLLADQAGSCVVNIWKDTYANYPPTVADKITASAPPTISAAAKAQDATLVGWTTAIAAGDILRFNVDSTSTVTRVQVCIDVLTL